MVVSDDTTGLPDGPAARWVRVALVVAVAVGLPLALVVLVIVRNPELSALDEQAHLDYVRRIEQLEIPRVGEKVLDETVRDAQCRTIQGARTAPCDLEDRPRWRRRQRALQGPEEAVHQPTLDRVLRRVLVVGVAGRDVGGGRGRHVPTLQAASGARRALRALTRVTSAWW